MAKKDVRCYGSERRELKFKFCRERYRVVIVNDIEVWNETENPLLLLDLELIRCNFLSRLGSYGPDTQLASCHDDVLIWPDDNRR
jgi:hypothetical protein